MTDLAARLVAAPVAVRRLLAVVAGAAGALAHAPFDLAPFVLVPLVAGCWMAPRCPSIRDAVWTGWLIGFGYFLVTLTWITEPFQVDAAATGWMAPFALVLLALLLGAFWALALGVARGLGSGAVALVAAWAGVEVIRAYLFTGFPWATPPQALVDGLAGQGLAWGGPHGMTALMVAVAALIAKAKRVWISAAATLVAFGLIVAPVPWEVSAMTGKTVRLIQPNAAQHEKWDPQMIPVFVNRQIDYVASGPVPDLVLMPETSLPYLQQNAQPVFDILAEAARGAPVVLGIQRRVDGEFFNGLVALDPGGQVTQTYDKHHLVPFGEYMPLPWFFRRTGIRALAERADGGYGSGPGPALMDLVDLGRAMPLICYEVVFAHNMFGTDQRPDFLMNLTNDAWFGARSGPQQHMTQARMRAIEQGLPMLRAANTGISAAIDPRGRVLDALALNTAGFLDVPLPAPQPPTPYARTGDMPWILLLALMLLVARLQHRRRARSHPIDGTGRGA
ncbi:MAG: apolipoprotein N-acyltransferase [Pseudomonadota bacterium]